MKTTCTLTLIALYAIVGCNKPDTDASQGASDTAVVMDGPPPTTDDDHAHDHDDHAGHDHDDHAHDDHGHAHPDHGPHEGELIELGNEAYHAELVHETDGVSIYVLDGSAAKSVSIESDSLTLSLKHDGKVQTFDLASNPADGDTEGKTSRFTSSDPELDKWLDAGSEGAVVIQIEGKSYTGKITHDHDHHGHDHE